MKINVSKFIVRVSILILIIGLFANVNVYEQNKISAATNIFFVSPSGDDNNGGTAQQPWKSLKKVAETLQAGDTAVFEDGVYPSDEIIEFSNNGTSEAPITIRARNKQQAQILFTGLNTKSKIQLNHSQYINIQDFEITQDVAGTTSGDTFINMNNCSNCHVSGNFIHGAGGKAVQALVGEHISVVDNTLHDFNIAVVLANVNQPVIAGNEIEDAVNAIMVPAGTRSAQIYNNSIRAVNTTINNGIVLGGSYPANVAYDPDGYETYHAAAWNNIIIAETPGLVSSALVFRGSTESGFYHNIVIDAKHGVHYLNGGSSTAGWTPENTSPKFYNNIFVGLTGNAVAETTTPINAKHDYNLYHNSANAPVEENGVYKDPLFIDNYGDWRLSETSPALGKGTELNVVGFYGEKMNVDIGYEGIERSDSIHLGIYANSQSELGEVLFTDDFENGIDAWAAETGTMEVKETDDGNHVFTAPTDAPGINRYYSGSMEWESYQLETRVKFDEYYAPNSWLTLYTRYTSIRDYYLLEIQGNNGYVALKKKVNGIVIPLHEKENWFPPTEEWIDIRFVVDGQYLKVYINDELLLSGTDTKLWHGAVAAAIYRSDILIDDVIVTKINAPTGKPEDAELPEPGGTYYVSPSGFDTNPGTEELPWKTMAYAAQRAQQGDTVIFEDGEYIETRPAIFLRGGKENERIVFKARNKHQAIIKFQDLPTTKILLLETPYITIQDFEITQNKRGTTTADILITARQGSHHTHIIGNKIHNAFEEGVKGYLVSDYLVEGNIIYDMDHEGIDFVDVSNSIIRNNEISEVGRVGIMVKGGASDIEIYNNYIHNHNVDMRTGAIYMGGVTGSGSARDPGVDGFEAWNLVTYNNIIVAGNINGTSNINTGISFTGSKDSAAYNNIVIGVKHGIYIRTPENTAPNVGWEWDPHNVNPIFMNNIIMNSTISAVSEVGPKPPVNLVHDYNLYYNNAKTPEVQETNGIYGDPLFINWRNGDFRLRQGSPAIGAGEVISGFTLLEGEVIDISLDYNGMQRSDPWDLGIFKYEPVDVSAEVYYVSPDGNDANPGTEEQPWKTLHKVATTLQLGDTAIFEDGVYTSDQTIEFSNSGTSEAPITIKARNKHQAKLLFTGLNTKSKIQLNNSRYITIQDFEITQDVAGTASSDIFINMVNCSNCLVSGNFIHGAGGKAVQALGGEHISFVDNTLYDFNIAVVLANVDQPVIAGNEIRDAVNAIMVPAGTRSAQIYNNSIRAVNTTINNGIVLGGSYPANVAYDPDGYETYHAAAWNNIIVAETPGLVRNALVFRGSTESGFYNNIVIDAQNSVQYLNGGGPTAGWTPENASPKFYNNIFVGCIGNAVAESNAPINPQHDYNLYHNCANAPVEANGLYSDPLFVDNYGDWHLSENSPALGEGITLDIVGFYGEKMNVDIDYDGVSRGDIWDLGIYKYVVIDNDPPTWPIDSGLTLSKMTHNSVQLTWPDAEDNINVEGYRLYVNDDEYANVASTSNEQIIDNLTANTSYKLKLVAYDTAGNESSPLIVFATTSSASSSSGQYSSGAYLSSNSYLNSLTVQIDGETVSLSPTFTAGQTNYTAQTDANQAEILPSPSHFAAKVTLQGEVVDQSIVVDLEVGDNVFELIVQAENGTTKTYTLTIHRESSEPETPSNDLTDLTGHWAENTIAQALLEGFVNGYPDGTFKPNNPITRAEFTVMLMNALTKQGQFTEDSVRPVETTLSTFIDQGQIGDWAQKAIAGAINEGMIQGYTDGQFRPNAHVTRAEMSVMIARALHLQLDSNIATSFNDDVDIPSWAKAAVEAIHKLGIVNGREQNMFVPNETATRAEATTMLLRLFNHVENIED